MIDQRIAEDDQLAVAQAALQAKVLEARRASRDGRWTTHNMMRWAVDKEDAWRKEVIDQLVAGDHTLGGRLAELDGQVAEADERHTEAGDRLAEAEGRMAETADQLVRENWVLLGGMRRTSALQTCERLLEADDPASEARSLLAGGVATAKKARETFELTSEFFEACPDGNPEGWDESDWRAFIAKGDKIVGAELPQVCDPEETSTLWKMDRDLDDMCSELPPWWDGADKGQLTRMCREGRRDWDDLVEEVKEADLQSQA